MRITTVNRRQFATALAACLAHPASLYARDSDRAAFHGVQLGVQTYSFHEIQVGGPNAVDLILRGLAGLGVSLCELFAEDLSPFPLPSWAREPWAHGNTSTTTPDEQLQRQQLRAWRMDTPMTYFAGIAQKFRTAGVRIFAYNYSFDATMTDAEIDRGFEQARALGTGIITASTTLSMARRLVPFADRHRTVVSFHGHSDVHDPDQFSTPETFSKALAMSDLYRINLDIGHFTAAGLDPVAFLRKRHAQITNLHIKDRKRNDGPNTPLGEGDTPVRDVLLLLRDQHYPTPALIEYEYVGPGTPEQEIARSLNYVKKILAS